MLDRDTKKSYGVTSAILAWLVFFSFTAALLVAGYQQLAADSLSDGAGYRGLQMSLGLLSLLFVSLRLLWWLFNPRLKAPRKMTENAYGLSRLTLLLLYVSIFLLALSGLANSWAMGYELSWFGLFSLPPVAGLPPALTAYLHRALLFFNYAMLLIYGLVYLYHDRRYKVGIRRMLPGMHG